MDITSIGKNKCRSNLIQRFQQVWMISMTTMWAPQHSLIQHQQEDPDWEIIRTLTNPQSEIAQALDRLQYILNWSDLGRHRDGHGRQDRGSGSVSVAGSHRSISFFSPDDNPFGSPRQDMTHTHTTDGPLQPHFPLIEEQAPIDPLEGVGC